MNKTNNTGQHIFVDCRNCNNFDTDKFKCKKENFNIYHTNFAEHCNFFDCDKNLNKDG